MLTPEEIEAFFHRKIPLTRAMGVRVLKWDDTELVLGAPLELNYNHLGTAFGGSLSALATLCGYGVLWLELGETDAHVVVRDSHMSFRRPVRHDLRAVSKRPPADAIAAFKSDLTRKGKAGITLNVEMLEGDTVAASLEGIFVALAGPRPAAE